MLSRPETMNRLRTALRRSRVIALVGPRQCGKTTLARQVISPESGHFFDLEDPRDLATLEEPMTALERLRGVVVIDEIQRRPELFPILRVLADRRPSKARFLVLGSASPELLRQSSESLAGRIEVIHLSGFSLLEVGADRLERHWRRGGFPRSFLARSEADSIEWRRQFVSTFLERDLPQMGINVPALTMGRFWAMLAHQHGGRWNAADPARSLGMGETAIRRYLDFMTGAFMVRQLPPWHENLAKRQVKAPKIYIRDSGLLHHLLGVRTPTDLERHPKVGASWEGYALDQVLVSVQPDSAYYWAVHQGAELDLFLIKDGRRIGIEFKRQDAPTMTSSLRTAIQDLGLDEAMVVYPGTRAYSIHERVRVMPLEGLIRDGLRGRSKRSRGPEPIEPPVADS